MSVRKVHYKFPGIGRLACGKKYTGGFAGMGGGAVATSDKANVTCSQCLMALSKYRKK